MELSEKIREIRNLKKLKQEDLANACNVTRSAISNWEADRRRPDWDNLVVLARLFGITIEELVGDELIYYENPEPSSTTKKGKKLSYVVPIINTVVTIILIIILLIILLPKINDKNDKFNKSSLSNIIGVSIQVKDNKQVNTYDFIEIEETITIDKIVFKVFELNDFYINKSSFSRYQFGYEYIFLLDITIKYSEEEHIIKFDPSKYSKIDNDDNVVQFLPENNLPIITTPGTYDLVVFVNYSHYFLGAYIK